MSDLGISNTLISMNLQCEAELSETNLALSQTLQMFCTEAFRPSMLIGASAANLCGSLFGFKAFSLGSKLFGVSSFATKVFSFGAKVVAEGTMFHIAPELLATRSLQTANLLRGSASSALMVGFSQGAGKLGGGFLIQQMIQDVAVLCSQDLSASLGWSEVQTGGVYTRLLYAQMSSCQMQVGAGVVHLTCHEITMMNAKVSLAESFHRVPNQTGVPQGWLHSIQTGLQGAFGLRSANEMPIEGTLHLANEQQSRQERRKNIFMMTGGNEGAEGQAQHFVLTPDGTESTKMTQAQKLEWCDKLQVMIPTSLNLANTDLQILPLTIRKADGEIVQIKNGEADRPEIERVLSAEEALQFIPYKPFESSPYARKGIAFIACGNEIKRHLPGYEMEVRTNDNSGKILYTIYETEISWYREWSRKLSNHLYDAIEKMIHSQDSHLKIRTKLEIAASFSNRLEPRYQLLNYYLSLVELGHSIETGSSILDGASEVQADSTSGAFNFTLRPTPESVARYGAVTGNLHALKAGILPAEIVAFSGVVHAAFAALKEHIKMPIAAEIAERGEAAFEGLILPVHLDLKGAYYPIRMDQAGEIGVTLTSNVKGRGSRMILTLSHETVVEGVASSKFASRLTVANDLSKATPARISENDLKDLENANVAPLLVTPELIAQFREASGDHNIIHGLDSNLGVAADRAARAIGLPDIILHGMATLNYATHVLYTVYAPKLHPNSNVKLVAKFSGYALPGDQLIPLILKDSLGAPLDVYSVHIVNQRQQLIGIFSLEPSKYQSLSSDSVAVSPSSDASSGGKGEHQQSGNESVLPEPQRFPEMQALAAQIVQPSAVEASPSSDVSTAVSTVEPRITAGEPPSNQVAFLFPGQGSQKVGMGKDHLTDPTYRQIVDTAEKSVPGLRRLMEEGPDTDLNLTQNTQPAILTMSVGIAGVLALRGVRADYFAGHSLGELSALAALGVIPMNYAPHLVAERGRFMQEAVPAGVGAMAAVIGVESGTLAEICATISQEKNQTVVIANQNGGGQFVISGHTEAVSLVLERVRANAKRVITKLLPVSAPFHSPLMEAAQQRFSPLLRGLPFHEFDQALRTPLVSTVDAAVKRTSAEAFAALSQQMPAPVLFEPAVQQLLALGVTTFVEVGPGSVLGGLVKRIGPKEGIHIFGTETPDQIAQVVEHCRSIGTMRMTMGVPSLIYEKIYPARTMAVEETLTTQSEGSPPTGLVSLARLDSIPATIPEVIARLDQVIVTSGKRRVFDAVDVDIAAGIERLKVGLLEAADLSADVKNAVQSNPGKVWDPLVALGPNGGILKRLLEQVIIGGRKNIVFWYFANEKAAKDNAAALAKPIPENAPKRLLDVKMLAEGRMKVAESELGNLYALIELCKIMGVRASAVNASGFLIETEANIPETERQHTLSLPSDVIELVRGVSPVEIQGLEQERIRPLPPEIIQTVNQAGAFTTRQTGKPFNVSLLNGARPVQKI